MSFIIGPSSQISSLPVPVSQGGLGVSTLAINNVLLGNGANPVQALTSGASGTVLTSNGPSALPAWSPAAGGQSFIAFGTTGGF